MEFFFQSEVKFYHAFFLKVFLYFFRDTENRWFVPSEVLSCFFLKFLILLLSNWREELAVDFDFTYFVGPYRIVAS